MNSGVKAPANSFEQTSFAQMQPMGCRGMAGGVLVSCLVLLLVPGQREFSPWLYGWLVVALFSLIGAFKAKTPFSYLLATGLVMAGCAALIGFVIQLGTDPMFWFLPVGLCLTLPGAALYMTPSRFVGIATLTWLTLSLVIQPSFPMLNDKISALLVVLGSMVVGAIGNRSILHLRRANFELQQELYLLAYVDSLTGLPNRRAFMERLIGSIASKHSEETLHFLMLDIDDFKKINDSLGHDVGDIALVELGKVIRTHAAGHNFARLGGEEFAVVAAGLDCDSVRRLANTLVQQTRNCVVQGCSFTLSIGVAHHLTGEGATSLMRRADEALYQAKQAGKDRYVMAVDGFSAN